MIEKNTSTTPASVGQTIKALSILRIAFAMGCTIFLGVVAYLIEIQKYPASNISANLLLPVAAAIFLVCSFVAKIFERKKLSSLNSNIPAADKLALYRSVKIFNFAMIELPVIVVIISYFLTANRMFLFVAPLLIARFFLEKINEDVIVNKLQLNRQELTQLK